MQDPGSFYDGVYRILESDAWRNTLEQFQGDDSLPAWVAPFSSITRSELGAIAAALNVRPDDHIVDLGCGLGGPGLWVAEQSRARLTGIDVSSEAVRNAQLRAAQRGLTGRATFTVAEMTNTGLPDDSCAGVMSIDAILFADPRTVVAEIRRILRRGGTVALTTLAPQDHRPGDEWYNKWKIGDYGPFFREGGFEIRVNEPVPEWHERALAFNAAIKRNATNLLAELGDIGKLLIAEAEKEPVTKVLVVAVRMS